MLNEKTIVAELKPQLVKKTTLVDSSVQQTNENKAPNSIQNFDVFSNSHKDHRHFLNDRSISTDTKILGNEKMISVIDIVQISHHKDSSSQFEKDEKNCSFQNMNNNCIEIQPTKMIDQSIQPENHINSMEINKQSVIAEFLSSTKSEIATEPSQINERHNISKNEIITEISPNIVKLENCSKSVAIEVKLSETVKMIDVLIQKEDENKTKTLEIKQQSTIADIPLNKAREINELIYKKEHFVVFENQPNLFEEKRETKYEINSNFVLADIPLKNNFAHLRQSICIVAEINPLNLTDESTQLEQKNYEINNQSTIVDIDSPKKMEIGTEPNSQTVNKSTSKLEIIADFQANKKSTLKTCTKAITFEVQPQIIIQMTDEAIQNDNNNYHQSKLEIKQSKSIEIEPKIIEMVEKKVIHNEAKSFQRDNFLIVEYKPTTPQQQSLNEQEKNIKDDGKLLSNENINIIQEIETEFKEVSDILKRLKSEKLFNIEFPADLLE